MRADGSEQGLSYLVHYATAWNWHYDLRLNENYTQNVGQNMT